MAEQQNATIVSTELLDELYKKLGVALNDMKVIIVAQSGKIRGLNQELNKYKNLYENALVSQKEQEKGSGKKVQR